MDDPLFPDGLCRILDEERQVVGLSYPPADDRADRYVLLDLFFGFPVLIKAVGAAVGSAAVIAITVICLLNPPVYSTEIMGNNEEHPLDPSYTVSLADSSYGDVKIIYLEDVEDYMLHADFKKGGDTVLTVVSPDGEKTEYDLHIERNTYELTKK